MREQQEKNSINISVIIPTYNRQVFIKKAINSVLLQTYIPKEIIIVDDGSSDNTLKKLNSFNDKIKILTQSNCGVSSARNRGIKEAKYDWIAFLDSDDLWDEKKLSLQVKYLQKNSNIKFVHTDEVWIRDTKIIKQKKRHLKPQGECFLDNLEFCKIAPSSVLMHKSIFEDIGYFDESLKVCEDYDLWLRVSKKHKIGLVKEPLVYKFGGHHDQLSFKYFAMDRFRIKALEKHIDSQYSKEVKDMIIKKCEILIKGAKKQNNKNIFDIYLKKLRCLSAID